MRKKIRLKLVFVFILLLVLAWLVTICEKAGGNFLGEKKASEYIVMPLIEPLNSSGAPLKPDSVHIITYADNGSAKVFSATNTTYPFSAVGIDTTKDYGDTAYWFVDQIQDIDGTAGNFELAIMVTFFCDGLPTTTRATVQVIDDSLNKKFGDIKTKTDGLNYDGNNILADVMAMNTGVVTATVIADNAIDAPTFADDAQFMVYGGAVWVDTTNGTAGAVVGVNGLPSLPCRGFVNAKTIADAIGVKTFCILGGGDQSIKATMNGYTFMGIGDPARNSVDLNSQDVGGSMFIDLDITGIQGGDRAAYLRCALENASLDAVALQCGLRGDITLLGDRDNVFLSCASSVPGGKTPTLIFSGGSESVQFRGYSGGLHLLGMGANDTLSFEAIGGQLQIGANVNVNAKITARGMITLTDSTVGLNNLIYAATAQYAIDSTMNAITDANKANFKADVGNLEDTCNAIIDTLQNQDDWVAQETGEIGDILDTLQNQDDWVATSSNQTLAIDTINAILDTLQEWDDEVALLVAMRDSINAIIDSLQNHDNWIAQETGEIADILDTLQNQDNWVATSANQTNIIDTTNAIIDTLQLQDGWVAQESSVDILEDTVVAILDTLQNQDGWVATESNVTEVLDTLKTYDDANRFQADAQEILDTLQVYDDANQLRPEVAAILDTLQNQDDWVAREAGEIADILDTLQNQDNWIANQSTVDSNYAIADSLLDTLLILQDTLEQYDDWVASESNVTEVLDTLKLHDDWVAREASVTGLQSDITETLDTLKLHDNWVATQTTTDEILDTLKNQDNWIAIQSELHALYLIKPVAGYIASQNDLTIVLDSLEKQDDWVATEATITDILDTLKNRDPEWHWVGVDTLASIDTSDIGAWFVNNTKGGTADSVYIYDADLDSISKYHWTNVDTTATIDTSDIGAWFVNNTKGGIADSVYIYDADLDSIAKYHWTNVDTAATIDTSDIGAWFVNNTKGGIADSVYLYDADIDSISKYTWTNVDTAATIDTSDVGAWFVNNTKGGVADSVYLYDADIDSIIKYATGAGTGTDTLDLYVFDSGNNAYQGVNVTVWNSGRTAKAVYGITTDVNGKVQLALTADTYHVKVHRTGIVHVAWDTVTVSSGGGVDTVQITALNIAAAPSADLCMIYAFVYDKEDNPRENCRLTVYIAEKYFPVYNTANSIITPYTSSMLSDADSGMAYMNVYRSDSLTAGDGGIVKYHIRLEAPNGDLIGSELHYEVPDSSSHSIIFE